MPTSALPMQWQLALHEGKQLTEPIDSHGFLYERKAR
jgi:hypothetical protein